MAVESPAPARVEAPETVFVDRFCDGIIGPSTERLGPVRDGGHIVANTAPGCWGPMITPAIKGGHEVTLPVAVEGAEVGDRPHPRRPFQRRSLLRQGVPLVRGRG